MQNFIKIQLLDHENQECLVNTEHITMVTEVSGGVQLSMIDGSTLNVASENLQQFKGKIDKDYSRPLVKAIYNLHELLRARLH